MMPPMLPSKGNPSPRKGNRWVLWASGFVVCTFFSLLDLGTFYLDRSKEMHHVFSGGAGVTGLWTIVEVLRAKSGLRARAITLGTIAASAAVVGTAGFLLGEEGAYPSDQKNLVHEIQAHAREVKAIKEQISGKRSSMTEPAQLLLIEPLVSSWKEHIARITDIDQHVNHETIPVVVNKILKLMNEALVFDNQQIQNLTQQFSVVRDGERLRGTKRSDFYAKKLEPLMDEEQRIEGARQASNLQQRIQEAARP
jgi:hypothetical protein